MDQQNNHANCVLLIDDAVGESAELHAQLVQRQWRVDRAETVYRAFSRLCLLERLQSSRAAWGLQCDEPPVLVLALPMPSAILDDLLAARDRYVSRTGVALWTDGRLFELRRAAPDPAPAAGDVARPIDAVPSVPAAQPAPPGGSTFQRRPLRLAEPDERAPRTLSQQDHDHDAAPDADDEAPQHNGAAALTAEEIRMLMGDSATPRERSET